MDCVFCKIAKKQVRASIVYEDEEFVAFEDLNPQAPVHVLVIPKVHIPKLLDLKEEQAELVGKMFLAANKIAREKGIAEKGFRTVFNCNREAGQSVFHLHLHLLGGRLLHWPPG